MCIISFRLPRKCLTVLSFFCFFFFSSRRRHTRFDCDWSSDVCSSDLSSCKPSQPGAGGGGGDGLHDDFVAGQWSASPVHRDVGEQPVLDLVPFGCEIGRASCRERV